MLVAGVGVSVVIKEMRTFVGFEFVCAVHFWTRGKTRLVYDHIIYV